MSEKAEIKESIITQIKGFIECMKCEKAACDSPELRRRHIDDISLFLDELETLEEDE